MKPTREEVIRLAMEAGFIVKYAVCTPYFECWTEALERFVGVLQARTDSVNLAKPLAEGAVAPGECGSVPFTFHELDLLRQWFNAVTDLNRAYLIPEDEALMLKIALLQHGMQPPNNQPNLICKSCGVDRSKEDCKGDRLRCGLAGVAYSDHVAVTSAEPESRVKPEPNINAVWDAIGEYCWTYHEVMVPVIRPGAEQAYRAAGRALKALIGDRTDHDDVQSGMPAPNTIGQQNEQNDAVQEEKQ